MNPATVHLLTDLGFECDGVDPDAPDHHRYSSRGLLCISVPSAGCSASDIARLIYHAGAAAARKEIRAAHEAYLAALKF